MSFCKIQLSIPGKSLEITMPQEEAEVWFAMMTSAMLDATQPETEQEAMWYKGFLLIRCVTWGTVKGWNAKTPMSCYRCVKCKGETMLGDLNDMRAKCGFCRKVWSYKTNLTDRVIRQVFVHELTHTLEESGEYNALSQAILMVSA